MNLKPVNGHILVEPVSHDTFIASQKTTYEEIGKIVTLPDDFPKGLASVGDSIYFDSWLIAKYPNPNDKEKEIWLVRWEDVRAVEPKE